MRAMMRIAIAEAKANFSDLIRRVEAGEDVELTRYGRAVARIVAADEAAQVPLIGAMRGKIRLAEDFDALPDGFAAGLAGGIYPE
jgi:prevent-host-death family protein